MSQNEFTDVGNISVSEDTCIDGNAEVSDFSEVEVGLGSSPTPSQSQRQHHIPQSHAATPRLSRSPRKRRPTNRKRDAAVVGVSVAPLIAMTILGFSFITIGTGVVLESWLFAATDAPSLTSFPLFEPASTVSVWGISGVVDNRTFSDTHDPQVYSVLADYTSRSGLVSVCRGSDCRRRGHTGDILSSYESMVSLAVNVSARRADAVNSSLGDAQLQADAEVLAAYLALMRLNIPVVSGGGSPVFDFACAGGSTTNIKAILVASLAGLCFCVMMSAFLGLLLWTGRASRNVQCAVLAGITVCVLVGAASVVLPITLGAGVLECSWDVCDQYTTSMGAVQGATSDVNMYLATISQLEWLKLLGAVSANTTVSREGVAAQLRLLSASGSGATYSQGGKCHIGPSTYLSCGGVFAFLIAWTVHAIYLCSDASKMPPSDRRIRNGYDEVPPPTPQVLLPPSPIELTPTRIRKSTPARGHSPSSHTRRSSSSAHNQRQQDLISLLTTEEQSARSALSARLILEHLSVALLSEKAASLQQAYLEWSFTVQEVWLPILDLTSTETWCRWQIEERGMRVVRKWILWCLKRVEVEEESMSDVPRLRDMLHGWLVTAGGRQAARGLPGKGAPVIVADIPPLPSHLPDPQARCELDGAAAVRRPITPSAIRSLPPREDEPVSTSTRVATVWDTQHPTGVSPPPRLTAPSLAPRVLWPAPRSPPKVVDPIQERYAALIHDCILHTTRSRSPGHDALRGYSAISGLDDEVVWDPDVVFSRLRALRR